MFRIARNHSKKYHHVGNLIKALLPESGYRHLAGFSESFDCLQKESEGDEKKMNDGDNVNDDDDRDDIISLLACCKINSV